MFFSLMMYNDESKIFISENDTKKGKIMENKVIIDM